MIKHLGEELGLHVVIVPSAEVEVAPTHTCLLKPHHLTKLWTDSPSGTSIALVHSSVTVKTSLCSEEPTQFSERVGAYILYHVSIRHRGGRGKTVLTSISTTDREGKSRYVPVESNCATDEHSSEVCAHVENFSGG